MFRWIEWTGRLPVWPPGRVPARWWIWAADVTASSSPTNTFRPLTQTVPQRSWSSPSADLHTSDTWRTPWQVCWLLASQSSDIVLNLYFEQVLDSVLLSCQERTSRVVSPSGMWTSGPWCSSSQQTWRWRLTVSSSASQTRQETPCCPKCL